MRDDSIISKAVFRIRFAIPLGFLPTKLDSKPPFDISQLKDPILKQVVSIYEFF